MFISKADRHEHNIKQAASYNARPGLLTAPSGQQEPAIVLRSSGAIHAVLPAPEALRLANEIADALAAHRRFATKWKASQ
jgi:hypothetical protein